MRPPCDNNMINYIYCEQIDPYNLSGNVFCFNHKEKLKFVDICLLTSLSTQIAPSCHDFWNKWSRGLCVTPIWWVTYRGNKVTHKSYLVMYLVTIIKEKLKFVDFCLLSGLSTQVTSSCLDFWNKWSWGLCVIPIWWITYHVNNWPI